MPEDGIAATGMIHIYIKTDDFALDEAAPDFQLEAPGTEAYVIGRSDSTSSYQPDIDVYQHGGQQKGVSRRHAVLMRYRGVIHLMDLESVNGTFINGHRLSPNTPYPFSTGDQVSLANLEVVIKPAGA